MLEKLFGKRSTGIIWLVSAGILLLMLAGFIAAYVLTDNVDLSSLVGYALFIALSLATITLPAFVQKRFRLYIPPFVQSGLCVYAVVYLVGDILPAPQNDGARLVQLNFLPAVGGFFLCAAVLACIYSLLSARAARKMRKLAIWPVPVLSFLITTLLLLIINTPSLVIALPPFSHGEADVAAALVNAAGYEFGALVFCVTAWITMRTGKGDWFTIRSFQSAERTKGEAVRRGDRTLVTVVENLERDDIDYRRLYRGIKRRFFAARVIFLVFYAAYLAFASVAFSRLGGVGYAIIAMTALGFALSAAVYIYEFILFRRGAQGRRLRLLKIARTAVKLYIFLLTMFATVTAGLHSHPVSSLVAVVMAIVNLSVLFYNLFGKPRRYPPAPPVQKPASPAPADMPPPSAPDDASFADMPPKEK